MTSEKKNQLLQLGRDLFLLGEQFSQAQARLDLAVGEHGLSAPEAVAASQLCSTIALQFTALEEQFLSLLQDEGLNAS